MQYNKYVITLREIDKNVFLCYYISQTSDWFDCEGLFMESKFWRKEPIKKFNTEQTIYSLVTDGAKNDLDLEATGFMGNSMTYKELFESSEDLAKSFNAMGVKEGDNVAILTISMPLVQQCLLSLSKIEFIMITNNAIANINSSCCFHTENSFFK